jgi:hypothetical protein
MSTVDITPTVDSVAQILRARTKDDQGQELGTFTAATRPTDVQVSGLIATAQADVIAQTGPLLGVLTQEAARSAVAMRTAMLVELSYFPEQVRNETANETGRLQAGTSGGSAESVLTVKADSYVISTRVPYARFVFKGTRYQAAQPPTIPPDADAQASAAILRDLTRP